VFGPNYAALVAMLGETLDEQLAWARSIQDPIRHVLFEPWQGQFKTLGRLQEFQDIEVQSAAGIFQQAFALCSEFGVGSERAAALMFDIKVQTGGIKTWVKSQILSDFEQLDSSGNGDVPMEVARLRIIATRSAASANPKWVADVQNRKLTIATVKERFTEITTTSKRSTGFRWIPHLVEGLCYRTGHSHQRRVLSSLR